MKNLSVAELATITAGELIGGNATASVGPDVVIDTRKATPGCLFVALPGSTTDGAAFAADAAAKGAVAVLCGPDAAVSVDMPVIRTLDPRRALALIAALAVAGFAVYQQIGRVSSGGALAACGARAFDEIGGPIDLIDETGAARKSVV